MVIISEMGTTDGFKHLSLPQVFSHTLTLAELHAINRVLIVPCMGSNPVIHIVHLDSILVSFVFLLYKDLLVSQHAHGCTHHTVLQCCLSIVHATGFENCLYFQSMAYTFSIILLTPLIYDSNRTISFVTSFWQVLV